MTKWSVFVVAVLTLSLGAHTVAQADDRRCELDPDTGQLKCVLVAQPSPPRTVRLSAELPLVWKRLPFNVGEQMTMGYGCVRQSAGISEEGVGYVVTLTNTATMEQLYLDYVCEWPGEGPPEPPPPPPTQAELVEANTQALQVEPTVSPPGSIGGLTGLDSWFWCADPGAVTTAVALRGWTASGAVEVVQLGWEVDGPGGVADTSTSCGSQDAPSVSWTPEARGEYAVTLTAVWAGTWDLTWNGVPMGWFPLGPISLTAPALAYPVDEYRGELTG
jgi:hypothetical protein